MKKPFATQAYRRANARYHTKAAFSLIEMLCALTILVVIIGVSAILFTNSRKVFTIGADKSDTTDSGLIAINNMVQDLEHAVADDVLTFSMRPDRNGCASFGFNNDEISCVSLRQSPDDTSRAAREIQYWVREMTNSSGTLLGRFELVRTCLTVDPDASDNCYSRPDWYDEDISADAVPVALNVTALAFSAPDQSGIPTETYQSITRSNILPAYVDIYLEILDEQAAKKAAETWDNDSATATEIVEQNARVYTARVCFHNRNGYKKR